jgi:TetR/AcrR family transcriptional repressor of nem operon
MGRPAEFDRDNAVQAAIRVFARHGFAAASTTDLLDGMGIGRQSLYGAFGDKRGLFLEALGRYSERSLARMIAAMDEQTAAPAALEAALMIDLGCGVDGQVDVETGCLGVGSTAEFGRSDPDVNALGDRAALAVIAALADRVRAGQGSGDLKPDLDPEAVARLLLTLKSGLKISARGGSTEAEIRATVRLVLKGLGAG